VVKYDQFAIDDSSQLALYALISSTEVGLSSVGSVQMYETLHSASRNSDGKLSLLFYLPLLYIMSHNIKNKSTQRAQTSANAKVSIESDPGFESGFECLSDLSQNVVDALCCRRQPSMIQIGR